MTSQGRVEPAAHLLWTRYCTEGSYALWHHHDCVSQEAGRRSSKHQTVVEESERRPLYEVQSPDVPIAQSKDLLTHPVHSASEPIYKEEYGNSRL